MNSTSKILFVTDRLKSAEILNTPYNLPPENFAKTGFQYFGYMGLEKSGFIAIVLDLPDETPLIKISLGIKDNIFLETLWKILNSSYPRVFALTENARRSSKVEMLLGIEPLQPRACIDLLESSILRNSTIEKPVDFNAVLTAENIHEAAISGKKIVYAPETLITPWARETAEALNIQILNILPSYQIVSYSFKSLGELNSGIQQMNELSNANSNLLFSISSLFWETIRKRFPSLLKKIIAPSVFPAEKGAYTGELSISMIKDFGLRGAILPSNQAYNSPKLQSWLIEEAEKAGLLIFSFFPLETESKCDIMAGQIDSRRYRLPLVLGDFSQMRINSQPKKDVSILYTPEEYKRAIRERS
ncbi:MAG: triose-phosphate isomerase [Candidatus Riflebacteria bacterium]|nr:triose-phosphate isomerase [Candidatus Riflebacteria bacterium]